jgi:glycosyltransferase involved in cell wall biosynthesis
VPNESENPMSGGGTSLSIALVGTRGIPARYGGFETCVEEVGTRLAARGHRIRVYCRRTADNPDTPTRYKGTELVYRPALKRRSLETLSHTGLSVAHLVAHRTDAAIVFNAANAPYLPAIRAARIPVATHVDGLEWQRAKWGRAGRTYYRWAETTAVRWSDALIADADGIRDYYRTEFDADTQLISYGAPRIGKDSDRLAEVGLAAGEYYLVVARFEPENHVDLIVDGYVRSGATKPLVVVGSAPYSDAYTRDVKALADDRVRFLGAVWDQDLLDQLYAGAYSYLHGHSVGGTNPSLLRAIGASTSTMAYDVGFNREVLGEAGRYFADPASLAILLDSAEATPEAVRSRAALAGERAAAYDWDAVADAYERLAQRLATRELVRPRRRHVARRSAASPIPVLETSEAERS